MIVDLERRGDKRMFITEQVASISENQKGLWAVQFLSSHRVFNYNHSRLLYLTHPEAIDLSEKGLYIRNRHITDVSELLRFTDGRHTFYRMTYANGYCENLDGNEVYVTRTLIDRNGGSTWDYLRKLAAETGMTTEDDENILSRQYDLVDLKRDNVPLAQYLGDKTRLAVYREPKQIIYPFGCNASQKAAVEAALTHQVSIIQGPPGTGKTQTILNIIANLLLANKTVLVVSNNNSAVENVAEKLAVESLDFIVAKLGSVQNKEAFIANQPDYPDMSDWTIEEEPVRKQAQNSLNAVTQGFDAQTRQAQLKAEYDALLKETKYNDMLPQKSVGEEWLNGKRSSQLMKLLNLYKQKIEDRPKSDILFRLKWTFSLGMRMFSFLGGEPSEVVASLESAYYFSRKTEIEQELDDIATTLQSIDIKRCTAELRSASLLALKNRMAKRYQGSERRKFTIKDIKPKTEEFLKEYPVVLSTTYSAKSCISKDMVFDYVIMDEASQVDIKTGALALSCAMNAVIVGDDKQLPNVVSREEAQALNAIQSTYNVDDRYNAVTHSFLQSCVEVFKDAPVTLLREHYRCHPKIIEFCNQKFYDGELVTMTTDHGEDKVLQVVRTVKGNHARGLSNQREIDVITQEVIPEYVDMGTVGIITPYRSQAEEINKAIGTDIASTVHKYQGRECDTIIMSMVDNAPTEFSDDPNLLNVAISRAKTHLCIVTNGNDMPKDTNLAQLIAYIQYNNFEVKESKLHSVFDLLYKQYTAERLAYEQAHPVASGYLSENLVHDMLLKGIANMGLANTEVLCHYPLSRLIADWNVLDEQEKVFAGSPFSHVDFLIYNSLTKRPLQVIEVDGWHFHKESETQQSRDALKDRILTKFGLRPHRISTTATINIEAMMDVLKQQERMKEETGTLHQYIAIDLKSFYASVECMERGLDPLDTCLVVADPSRTEKTICLAVSPALKSYGIGGRPRLFEVAQRVSEVNRQRGRSGKSHSKKELDAHKELAVDYLVAQPRMAHYIRYSTRIYKIYLRHIAPEDIHVYSIDEVFMDVTSYLKNYRMTAHELAMKIIREVLAETGITATAGIGTNLYLSKVAMDIVAKKMPADKDGVRIAELDEMTYRRLLWEHTPLTDFWRVGRGIAARLAAYGILTMGDIARCSVEHEDLLYKLFGVNAELLIDHAWGWEPVTMDMIKAYRPETSSISSGQVLQSPYTSAKARNVVLEMADSLSLDLVDKKLVTDQLVLTVGYDTESLTDKDIREKYQGKVSTDRYGRQVPAHAHGTVNMERPTSSGKILTEKVGGLFDRIVNRDLLVRRITLSANHLVYETNIQPNNKAVQLDLFTDYEKLGKERKAEEEVLVRERRRQEAVLQIKKKFGKNAILKGLNYADGATQKERNQQIGGHHE